MPDRARGLLRLALSAVFAGVLVGSIGSAFHACLDFAERWRIATVLRLHEWPLYGVPATVLAVAAAAAVARFLVVQFAPMAAGSGVQHVEAVVNGEAQAAPPIAVPVKFVGGVLAIGAGLALGREGPTVQMGATISTLCSARLLADMADRIALHAAGAGAGLAVAFNAPLAGCVFVFEELTKRLNPRLVLATLAATGAAIGTMRALLGDRLIFLMPIVAPAALAALPAFVLLGLLLGLAGVAYAAATLALLRFSDRQARVPSVVRAAAIGAIIGGIVWIAPSRTGGGELLTQLVISGGLTAPALLWLLALRVPMGPISYAAGTPGGLFMPLLLVGAVFGALFALGCDAVLPSAAIPADTCAVAGMSAFFAAVVRAPLTGIALAVEMTGRGEISLSILVATCAATLTAALVGGPPIYDNLRTRMLKTTAPVL